MKGLIAIIIVITCELTKGTTTLKIPYSTFKDQSHNRTAFTYRWHWTDKDRNQFWCSSDPNSIFQTKFFHPKNGHGWWTYRCEDEIFWNQFTKKRMEGFIGGALFLDRVRGTIMRDWVKWFAEFNLDHPQFHIANEMNPVWNHEFRGMLSPQRLHKGKMRMYEPVWLFLQAPTFFLLYIFLTFIGMYPLIWLSHHIVTCSIKLCVFMGFLLFPVRKLCRWIISTSVQSHRKAMWFHARDQKWFIWIRTTWKLFYLFRDHVLEEQPYQLVFRKPPNMINYAMNFLSKHEYHKYDLHIWEINFVDDMLEEKENFPAIVAWTLQCFLGEKYNQYCKDSYDRLIKSNVEADSDSSSDSSDYGDNDSDDDEETKKEKAKLRMQERAKRYANLKKEAENEFFKRLKQINLEAVDADGQPAVIINPYDYDDYLQMNEEQQKETINEAKDILKRYEVPIKAAPKPAPPRLPPTKSYVHAKKQKYDVYIPLINTMVWPHHLEHKHHKKDNEEKDKDNAYKHE